jgi:hypothetical protein
VLPVVFPPTGGDTGATGGSLLMLLLTGAAVFIAGLVLIGYAARRRGEEVIRIDE